MFYGRLTHDLMFNSEMFLSNKNLLVFCHILNIFFFAIYDKTLFCSPNPQTKINRRIKTRITKKKKKKYKKNFFSFGHKSFLEIV